MGQNQTKSKLTSSSETFPTIFFKDDVLTGGSRSPTTPDGFIHSPETIPAIGTGTPTVIDPSQVATQFTWNHGGHQVYITGSFLNWEERVEMTLSANGEFSTVVSLPPGTHQYKFIVDGDWRFAPNQATTFDGFGNVNNCIDVQAPNTDDAGMSALSDPGSPYDQSMPDEAEYAKAPPTLPPHLKENILTTRVNEDPSVLPLPHYVTLNHALWSTQLEREGEGDRMEVEEVGGDSNLALVVALTERVGASLSKTTTKHKFVTTILYKPL